MTHENRKNGKGTQSGRFLAGFLVGGLVGAGIALLQAPQSGEETRQLLKQKPAEMQRDIEQAVVTAQTRVRETADQITENADDLQSRAAKAARKGQKHVRRAAKEAQRAAEAVINI